MYFLEKGQGQALVFLHGFCETSLLWQDIAGRYASRYKIYVPDLPGFGKTLSQFTSDPSIDTIADELKNWLDEQGIDKPVLIGHSLGGYIILSLLERHPELAKAVALVHSTAKADTDIRKENRLKVLAFIERNGVPKFIESFVPSLFRPENVKAYPEKIRLLIDAGAQTPIESITYYTLAMRARPDRMHVLSGLTIPGLFIAGQEDQTVPLEFSREHRSLSPWLRYEELPDTGHMGMLEQRSMFLKALDDFLETV